MAAGSAFPKRTRPGGGRAIRVITRIGGTVDDSSHLRARLGYEFAAPKWLIYGLTLDSDFTTDLVVSGMIEAATPFVLMLPSLSGGVGVPVRVLPEAEVGIRIQLGVQYPVAGFVTSFDIYPGLDADDPNMFEVTLLFQVGL